MTDNKYKTLAESSNGKWWEFYFVRYSMGTIVGSLIVLSLIYNGKNSSSDSTKDYFYELYDLLGLAQSNRR
jgi:hypothetical protein